MVFETKKKKKSKYFIFFIFGCWLALGNAPFSFSYFALLALPAVAFFWARHPYSPLDSGLFGGFFGIGYFLVTLLWLAEPFFVGDQKYLPILAPFAVLVVSVYLSIFWGIAFFLASYFGGGARPKIILNLIMFLTLSELARSFLFGGFPWGLVSYISIDTPLSQLASLFGPYFLSFVIYFLYFSMIISKSWMIGSIVLNFSLYLLGSFLYFQTPLRANDTNVIRLVQPNIKQSEKWDKEKAEEFYRLYVELGTEGDKADVIILPETVTAIQSTDIPDLIKKISKDFNTNLIFGARRLDKDNSGLYNSILFFDKSTLEVSIYDKYYLVPFGEYLPLINWFVSKQDMYKYGFSKGSKIGEIKVLNLPTLLPAICYEIIFSVKIGQRFKDAGWILNLTNDAWFGNFSGPQQHFIQARMRSIELGIPLVRVANTGITAVINSNGSVKNSMPLDKRGALTVSLPARESRTLYSFVGPLNWIILLTALSLLSLLVINRKNAISS